MSKKMRDNEPGGNQMRNDGIIFVSRARKQFPYQSYKVIKEKRKTSSKSQGKTMVSEMAHWAQTLTARPDYLSSTL